ncbi:hypothetical protein ACTXN4_07245 [Pseudomonas helleri]|uniref:hypothetical protein n=1 Tax=Pseudomonas helleri TaxID=1608996 RepID=UPI003FCF5218
MLTSSAYLALVLHCASSLHPASIHPITDAHSLIQPDASGMYGDASPCPLHSAMAAVLSVTQGKQSAIGMDQVLRYAKTIHLAEADLGEIVPGLMQDPKASALGVGQPNHPAPPTYESWDVLRQYPRAAPLAEPRTPAAKQPDDFKPSKDSKDAQGKTATE